MHIHSNMDLDTVLDICLKIGPNWCKYNTGFTNIYLNWLLFAVFSESENTGMIQPELSTLMAHGSQ